MNCTYLLFTCLILLLAELVAMNENFVKARGAFEQMMEESLARHTGGMLKDSSAIILFTP